MKILIGMFVVFFLSVEGFSQIRISPIVGVKKSFHRKIKNRDLSRPEQIYALFGIRTTLELNDQSEFYIGFDYAKYTSPWDINRAFYGQYIAEDFDIHISAIGINLGMLFKPQNLYYKIGFSANYLRDFSIRYVDERLVYSILWSGKDNGNKANLYNGELGLGYELSHTFIEFNFSLTILVDAAEIESFKGNSSISFLAGYRFQIFDSKENKDDGPDF